MTTGDYISDAILLGTALVGIYYAYETHKIRTAAASQLDAMRKAALLSAYASLFQIHSRIVEQDCQDASARQSDHYREAIATVSMSTVRIRQLVAELEQA